MEAATRQVSGRSGGAAAAGRQRGVPPGPGASPAPDLDVIIEAERRIFDRRRFASRSELLAALHAGIDAASLDRVLEYLERSAKISTGDGSIRWTFGGAGPAEDSNGGRGAGGAPAAGGKAEEPVHILSMEERLPADLDNDLPYSEYLERVIADCQAGRAAGKTYTAEEYLKAFDHEFGSGSLEN